MMMAIHWTRVLKITQPPFCLCHLEHQMIMVLKKEGTKQLVLKIEMQLLEVEKVFQPTKVLRPSRKSVGNTTVKAMNLVGTFQFIRSTTPALGKGSKRPFLPRGIQDPYEAFLAHLVEKTRSTLRLPTIKHSSSPVNVKVRNDGSCTPLTANGALKYTFNTWWNIKIGKELNRKGF